jgi:hypothetical protein
MSEFVKQTMLGGYKKVDGGQSDPECSHVILTKKEYAKLLQKISDAEQESRTAKADADMSIQKTVNDARRDIATTVTEATQKVAGLEDELAAAQKESAFHRGLNANLLRIAKERANADRKLKPKKDHTGYVVLSSMEKEYRHQDGGRRWRSVMLWETVMQTPYTVGFTIAEVKELMSDLFQNGEDGQWLIQKIGINGSYDAVYADLIKDRDWWGANKHRNTMLDRRLKANYRTGYWEVTFMHTKPLGAVPPDMRAG